jgi:peptidoglycan hydrolase-like protein with peptidoglycan-binding domain
VPPSLRRVFLVALAMVASFGAVTAPAAVAKKPGLGDRSLRPGATGPDVRALQRTLRATGIRVKVDGQFGPSTVRAVKRFQRAAQLTPSGVVGRKTLAALKQVEAGAGAGGSSGYDLARSTTKSKASLGSRVPLKRGMRGQDIRVLQDFLTEAGHTVSVDGHFGSSTLKAVKAFEQAVTRPVDGLMDAVDIEALRARAAAGAPPAPAPVAPGEQATIGPDGLAIAPASAPEPVKQIIAAGNQIASKPYKYGGGHAKFDDTGYDCSGSVSYALHGAGLLEQALPSGGFVDWGDPGPGQWVTIYAHSGHMYMVVAGLRFDTSGRTKNNTRWQTEMRSSARYTVRHPPGL